MNDGHDARHRTLASRLSYFRNRIAYPGRRSEKPRLEAIESDVLAGLEHLTGDCMGESERPAD